MKIYISYDLVRFGKWYRSFSIWLFGFFPLRSTTGLQWNYTKNQRCNRCDRCKQRSYLKIISEWCTFLHCRGVQYTITSSSYSCTKDLEKAVELHSRHVPWLKVLSFLFSFIFWERLNLFVYLLKKGTKDDRSHMTGSSFKTLHTTSKSSSQMESLGSHMTRSSF